MAELSEGETTALSCIGMLVLIPVSVVLDGWALSVVWNWFAAPYLHTPGLAVVPAIGVRLVASLLQRYNAADYDIKDKWYVAYLRGVAIPLLAVGMGWVLRLFL